MPLIKSFGFNVGYLDMQVYTTNFGFLLSGCGCEYLLQALRA